MPFFGFSPSDLEAVRRAVAAAEAESAGEIVPYVVPASDSYANAVWKAVAFGAMVAALVAWAIHQWGGFWGGQLFFWMVVPPAAGGALGLLAVHLAPPVRRWLAGAELMELRTHQRAAAAFVEQEVFQTSGRTGILIFLSLFERRVVVVADSGIHSRVEDGEWDAVVARVVEGIRRRHPKAVEGSDGTERSEEAEGTRGPEGSGGPAGSAAPGALGAALAAAIRDCGDLLVRHGLPRPAGRRNELGDDLRRGEP